MSIDRYKSLEQRWANTKPIRGRSVDVRPIGERRRDWEQITRKQLDEGMWSYSATLYGTDCVEYLPNGDIILRSGGGETPSTAEFINDHSPFGCYKHNKKLWALVRVNGEHPREATKAFPVGKELRLNFVGIGYYRPDQPVMVQKKVVNRQLAKEARAPLQPFLKWAKSFLALSDGWVMHETRKQALGWETRENGSRFMPLQERNERALYETLTRQMEINPEDTYLRVLCCLAMSGYSESKIAESVTFEGNWGSQPHTFTQKFEDLRTDYPFLKRKVDAWVKKFEKVHDIIEVEPDTGPIHGAV